MNLGNFGGDTDNFEVSSRPANSNHPLSVATATATPLDTSCWLNSAHTTRRSPYSLTVHTWRDPCCVSRRPRPRPAPLPPPTRSQWPRHSADFTLLRAYVGPAGESAEPSPNNVPYKPSQYVPLATLARSNPLAHAPTHDYLTKTFKCAV